MVRAEEPMLEWAVASDPRQALEPPAPEPEGHTEEQQGQQQEKGQPALASSEAGMAVPPAASSSTTLDGKVSASTPTSLESVAAR